MWVGGGPAESRPSLATQPPPLFRHSPTCVDQVVGMGYSGSVAGSWGLACVMDTTHSPNIGPRQAASVTANITFDV